MEHPASPLELRAAARRVLVRLRRGGGLGRALMLESGAVARSIRVASGRWEHGKIAGRAAVARGRLVREVRVTRDGIVARLVVRVHQKEAVRFLVTGRAGRE